MSQNEQTKHQPAQTPPAEPPKTNSLAIASLVTSFFFQLVGLILGIIALGQIKKTGEGGKGLAVAGIVISAIGMLAGLLFGFLLLMGIIAASNIPDEPSPKPDDVSIIDEKPATNTPEVAVGKETHIDNLKIKVISVKEPELGDYQKPKAGNYYLNVELEVTNDGYETEYISAGQTYLKDLDNNKYNYSLFATPTDSPSIRGELASNDTVRGVIGFEVPKGADELKFYFEGTNYNGAAAVVDLNYKY